MLNALKSKKKFKENELRLSKARKHVKEEPTPKQTNKSSAMKRINKKKKN
jgi:hypothetical protein